MGIFKIKCVDHRSTAPTILLLLTWHGGGKKALMLTFFLVGPNSSALEGASSIEYNAYCLYGKTRLNKS